MQHSLGLLIADWIEAHCEVPAGVYEGEPFQIGGWQMDTVMNHYRIKPNAVHNPKKLLAPFEYRRSFIVGSQKKGKSPLAAALVLVEAVGPSLFAGWAKEGDQYRCQDHGCGCGWVYDYIPGDAKGEPRSKSLIGLLAFAESQTRSVFDPLVTMIETGPLKTQMAVRAGEIRLPNRGLVLMLTSGAKSKLGRPFTFAIGDESALFTDRNGVSEAWSNMRRATAGMQGRSLEMTNAWDSAENSSAQNTWESQVRDIYKYWRLPDPDLDYGKKRDRAKIHDQVYADAPWVDPRGIDAEADEIVEKDPARAERFFGNRVVQGKGAFLPEKLWDDATDPARAVADGETVCLGMDGSANNDWTAIRAETLDGHRFTPVYGPDGAPTWWNPEAHGGRIPTSEVDAAVKELFAKYDVARFYIDPHLWETQSDAWAGEFGDDVVVQWPTNQSTRMYDALTRYREDLWNQSTTHSDDPVCRAQALAAAKLAVPGDKFKLGKPSEHQKIDILMADILTHEAAADMRTKGWASRGQSPFVHFKK